MPDSYRLDLEVGAPLQKRDLIKQNLPGFMISEQILPGGSQPYTTAHGTTYLDVDVTIIDN